ncbi:hypothetical protein [Nocardia aurantiaca]|uniref:Uncharacterized protein n=1 Tax=Nocardia aurantiaca TaxID=2675850 RepID=A0A6I3KST4_9NOCA|nr:hypothetical protein [Nocardia aurantiaca]MTE11868.1 hypothetical protein [Nocardia aurantiaca]
MSHPLATQAARSTGRAAQMFRYSAIVTASMASIGLTVAAGSYIANEMAQQPGKLATTSPTNRPAPVEPGAGPDAQPGIRSASPIAEKMTLTSLFTGRPMEAGSAQTIPAPTPGTGAAAAADVPRPLGGQLRLGTAYVGAQVAAAQHDTVTLTLDTNVFATVADVLRNTPVGQQLGVTSDPSANTRLRTDVDSHGDVTLTLSDPALGNYRLQIARHPVPAPTADAHGEDAAVAV